VCERREKKGKIFVLLKELACTHLMYECMYGRRKKKVHAFGRETTTIM
jgi:hypothetical protein